MAYRDRRLANLKVHGQYKECANGRTVLVRRVGEDIEIEALDEATRKYKKLGPNGSALKAKRTEYKDERTQLHAAQVAAQAYLNGHEPKIRKPSKTQIPIKPVRAGT